ncbi:KTSC domain-containing protein [Calorimonas adulescens]|uniref:KTSC domain-containing protein n=1 Tax=Calorimonas adulescens TaxID=2606906 RepID=A0A5D8Q831_9THEO|nr:KTSC domain-containing protein [Calorimonas adulescens]
MERQNVQSSNLRSIGYDQTTQTLEIEFNNGGIYQYYNVPQIIYEGLLNASSHGKFFHQYIKDIKVAKITYK